MKITEKTKKTAASLMKSYEINEIFVNSKGEFFTDKNRASLSVGNDKKEFVKLTKKEIEPEEK